MTDALPSPSPPLSFPSLFMFGNLCTFTNPSPLQGRLSGFIIVHITLELMRVCIINLHIHEYRREKSAQGCNGALIMAYPERLRGEGEMRVPTVEKLLLSPYRKLVKHGVIPVKFILHVSACTLALSILIIFRCDLVDLLLDSREGKRARLTPLLTIYSSQFYPSMEAMHEDLQFWYLPSYLGTTFVYVYSPQYGNRIHLIQKPLT